MNTCEHCEHPCEEAHWTTIGGDGYDNRCCGTMDVPVPCCLCAYWGVKLDPDKDLCDLCLARFNALQPTH